MTQKSSYNREELLECGQGRLFGPDKPRLPTPNMLMFDRVTHISETGGAYDRGQVIAELDVTPDLWFFGCHFVGDPVMPGCLGLDAMWQLLGFYLAWTNHTGRGRALGCGAVKFFGQVLPEAKIVTYTLDIKRLINRKLVMGIADSSLAVDGTQIYTASDLKVGLFQDTSVLAGS